MRALSKILLGILIIIFLGAVGFIVSTQRQTTIPGITTTAAPTPQPTQELADSQQADTLLAGGSSYHDPEGIFTFLYPNDWKIDQQNNETITRVYQQGPTQQGQTEMYDGVIVTFEKIPLNGKTLSSWLDTEIKNMTADGTSQITEPKKPITVNGFPGYSYSARGLGEFTFLVIQKNSESPTAIRISTLVADPKNIGFQSQVDAILQTLQLQK